MTEGRVTRNKKRTKYVDYSSTDAEEDLEEYIAPEEEEKAKAKASRVPKKKLKKTTEQRIKEVVGDSQNVKEEEEENGDDMVDEGESSSTNINTKRLLDARSKKAKRMDWEQGFFYLPKFDCYLPRHILHMILEYVPPFPYFLNIRSVSQQWLDDFDTEICQNVKELDLVQRNDIDYELVRYNFPWYDLNCSTRRNNDCIRFLAILFPFIEKLIVPAIGANVRVPNNILKLFRHLQTMEIFYVCPITMDVSYNPAEVPLTYRQDITNIQSINYTRYLTQFCTTLVMAKDDNSSLITLSNCMIPENVISLFKYLVKEQHFSLKRLNILSLPENLYSKTLIDFILEENAKHVERGYGSPHLTPGSHSIYISNDEIADYMYEKEFFKTLISTKEVASYDWDFISQILTGVASLKVFKMLFEQANFPLVFQNEINPLLWLIQNNISEQLPQIVEFLCTLNPSLITMGNAKGIVNGDEKNVNILHRYIIASNNEYDISEKVIASLIKIGCDIKFICPTTGNNLIHIHPTSPSLIDALPLEFILMKNNKGFNPLERLVKRIEIENNVGNDDVLSAIDAFGKVYKKFELPINDVKFDKNQNLLHKFINLNPRSNGLVASLITHGVDTNSVDENGNIPLFYYLEKGWKSDTDLSAIMAAISEETLSKRFNGKPLLANIIERYQPEESNNFYFGYLPCNLTTLDLIENLLSRGCNLDESLSELSETGNYEKYNLDLNKSIFLMRLLHTIIHSSSSIETLRKIFKRFDNFEDLLIKPCTLKGILISPLMYFLSIWKNFRTYRQNETHQVFHSDDPLINPKLLENIINIPNKKIDALYYTALASSNSNHNWQYLEGILGVKIDSATWGHRPTKFEDIASCLASYRYEDEVFGNINIVQLATIIGSDSFLRQIEQSFSNARKTDILDTLTNEPFKNGTSVLDELAKRGLFSVGNIFVNKTNSQSNPVEWTTKHFRLALEANNYEFCYEIIQGKVAGRQHDFTKEEILQIIVGCFASQNRKYMDKTYQLDIAEYLSKQFSRIPLEERFKMFGTRFQIIVTQEKTKTSYSPYAFNHSYGWSSALDTALSEAKSAWVKTENVILQEPKHLCLSILDTCYWQGLIYLFLYLLHEDTTGRKKKKALLANTELSQDLLINWLTTKCPDTGKTLLHLVCEDWYSHHYDYPSKCDMINDLSNYLSSIDREDVFNIQDNEGKTAAFYALESGQCVEIIFKHTDLSIKNNKGEAIFDILDEDEKITHAKYFEVKEEKKEKPKPKKSTPRKKKKESSEEEKEEKPKRKSTRRKKKQDSDDDAEMDDSDDDDYEDKPKKKRVTRKRK